MRDHYNNDYGPKGLHIVLVGARGGGLQLRRVAFGDPEAEDNATIFDQNQ